MKKFSALILCFLMVITCGLAGCATFSINKVKYYNEVVASVGDTNITRYDLLNAYNSYGSSYYVSQQGQSESEAMASTLDLLIDRELLYQYAVENKEIYGLTPYQVNSAIEEIFESIDKNMADYVTEAKKILDIEIIGDTSESKEDATAYKYEDYDYAYSRRAEIRHNENGYYIAYIEDDSEPTFSAIIDEQYLTDYEGDAVVDAIIDAYLVHFKKSLVNESADNQNLIYNKVISLLADDLIEYEYYLRDANGKKYSTDTDSLLKRYFERTYNNQIKSQYLENVRVEYLKSETLSIDLLKTEFVNSVEYNYAKYNNHIDKYKEDIKAIGTDGDNITYHPALTDDTKFGYFVHTLLSFSDKQKKDLETLEKNKNSMSAEKYQLEYNKIVLNTTVDERDINSGLTTDNVRSLDYILGQYSNINTLSEFIEFMFKYTGDTATLSAGMPYVVGNNGYSDMQQEFTDECVRLMTEGSVGDMTVITDYTDIENAIVDYEQSNTIDNAIAKLEDYGFVITTYGIHLVYYVNDVSAYDVPYTSRNEVYFADDNNSSLNLYYKEINPLTHETYFDMLFDTVYPATSEEENYTSNNGYTEYEERLVEAKKDAVTIYKTKLKSTKTNI